MKKMIATRFFEVNPMGNVATLLNAREAMNNLKSDNFRYNRSIREVASVYDLDFRNRYCFIANASGKVFEVDSLEEAKRLFSNIGGDNMYNKKDAMRAEAKAAIIKALQDGYSGYYCDLHNKLFGTDYYVIGTYQAKQALIQYDIWDAIEKVSTYQEDNYGEIFYSDLSDPEKLITALYYIIGEEVLNEMMDGVEAWHSNWNNRATDETNVEILKAIEERR